MSEFKGYDLLDYVKPTPVITLQHEILDRAGVHLDIKQDYLNLPLIQGNKLWKLRNALLKFEEGYYNSILSYGGAYSNHLAALGAACTLMKIPATMIVRGEQPQTPGYTLRNLLANPYVTLHFVSRPEYRRLTQNKSIEQYPELSANTLIIPEGGTSKEYTGGLQYLWEEIVSHYGDTFPDEIWIPAGTGGTAAGLLNAINLAIELHIVHVLKHPGLEVEINNLLSQKPDAVAIHHMDAHHGGYAKVNNELFEFIEWFFQAFKIPLDPIYNAKSCFQLFKQIQFGKVPRGRHVLLIHTGGLQGIAGTVERFGRPNGINWAI